MWPAEVTSSPELIPSARQISATKRAFSRVLRALFSSKIAERGTPSFSQKDRPLLRLALARVRPQSSADDDPLDLAGPEQIGGVDDAVAGLVDLDRLPRRDLCGRSAAQQDRDVGLGEIGNRDGRILPLNLPIRPARHDRRRGGPQERKGENKGDKSCPPIRGDPQQRCANDQQEEGAQGIRERGQHICEQHVLSTGRACG